MPSWLESDVLDVRTTVIQYLSQASTDFTPRSADIPVSLIRIGISGIVVDRHIHPADQPLIEHLDSASSSGLAWI
jgi:hypothetical protein